MEYGPYAHRDAGSDPKLPPLGVFFYEEAVKDEAASAAGTPVYDKTVRLRIVIPGAKNSWPIYEIVRTKADGSEKVDHQVMKRFKGVYDEWKSKRTPAGSGTPLEQWALIDVALVAAFKEYNVFTVQQLAALHDGFIDNVKIPRVREWRGKAQAWLDEAASGTNAIAQAERIAKLEEMVKQQAETIAKMARKENSVGFTKKKRKNDDIEIADVFEEEEAAERV